MRTRLIFSYEYFDGPLSPLTIKAKRRRQPSALGALFLVCAATVLRSGEAKHARRMFSFSILYLFLLFGLLLVDKSWHMPI